MNQKNLKNLKTTNNQKTSKTLLIKLNKPNNYNKLEHILKVHSNLKFYLKMNKNYFLKKPKKLKN